MLYHAIGVVRYVGYTSLSKYVSGSGCFHTAHGELVEGRQVFALHVLARPTVPCVVRARDQRDAGRKTGVFQPRFHLRPLENKACRIYGTPRTAFFFFLFNCW